jgi:periplasmic protein TonB
VTMPSTIWYCVGASALVHVVFGWQLYRAPAASVVRPARDTFQVRMVALPPAAPEPPPPPAAPLPEPPEPPRPRPRPKPVEVFEPAPARVPAAEPAPSEPASAPAALLADSGPALTGGVVQLAGAPIGALVATASLSRGTEPPEATRRVSAPLAKLSDLSRRPMAPSLDAALRQNYPAEMRRRGIAGQAEVRVVIDPRGSVGQITIISESAAGFADACRKTLLGSRWSEPIDRDGNPVSTRLTYRCRFQIER